MEFKMEYSRSSRNVLFNVFSDVTSMRITKKIDSQLGPLCGVCTFSPHLRGFYPGAWFSPIDKRCAHEVNWHVSIVPVWVCGCECVLQWKGVLSRVGAYLCLELPGVALSPLDPELKMIFWKITLLVFINLS